MGIKISALPAIVTPALSDIFPVVQSGVTYKESLTQLTSLFATAGANSNIKSLTGLTGVIQAPTFINDASSNHVVGFQSMPSAVNYINLINSPSGSGVALLAAGADTNVSAIIGSKGTGQILLASQNTTLPLAIYNGTLAGDFPQHETLFSFANTAATRTVTFPDANGTIYLASKANGTEAANAVTASGTTGVITTSSLTTAGGASYAITWTNTFISSTSTIILSLMGGTNTTLNITLKATAGSGSSSLTIYNNTAATSLNGTILIGYLVIP